LEIKAGSERDVISFTLPIDPVAKARPRLGRNGQVYTPKETVQFENLVRMLSARYKPKELLTGPIKTEVTLYLVPPKRPKNKYPIVRPDWDNLAKSVCDALNGVMWKDDSQVFDAHVKKLYDWTTKKGSIEIKIEQVEES
jgi:Holliday junction resolvase RusA-like endonuclease